MRNKPTLSIIVSSCIFWPLATASLPFYNLLLLIVWPIPPRLRHSLVMSATAYFTFLLKYVGKIDYQVTGLENLPCDPAIIVSNHQSAWETVVFNRIFPQSVWIMKKEVLSIPLYGWGVRALSPIAIDRQRGEDSLLQVIRQSRERMKLGFWITVFPEGTRLAPTKRKPFKFGSAKMAMQLKVPIVPVAHNAGYFLPRKSFWLYPGTVTIVIGKAMYPTENDPVKFTKQFEAWIVNQLEQMGA